MPSQQCAERSYLFFKTTERNRPASERESTGEAGADRDAETTRSEAREVTQCARGGDGSAQSRNQHPDAKTDPRCAFGAERERDERIGVEERRVIHPRRVEAEFFCKRDVVGRSLDGCKER